MDVFLTLFRRYLRAAWRRRWLGLGVAWIACLIGWGVVSLIPNQYTSNARLYVDTDAVLTPLLKGLAVDATPADRLAVLQQTLLSRPNLERLISKTDLELTVNDGAQRDVLIASLQKRITVAQKPTDPRGVFWISYSDRSPQLAQNVVNTLLNIFTENASSRNRTDMENAREFLQRQIASYEIQLRSADQRRAAFRAQYPALFSNDGQKDNNDGLQPLDALNAKLDALQGSLQDNTILADQLQKDISGPGKGGSGRVAASNPKLAEAEANLKMLQMRYTDSFPDVVAARQQIEALKSLPSGGGSLGPSGDSIGHEQIALKLAETKGTIAALQRQIALLKDSKTKLEQVEKERPNLVVEYENMDRDYSVLRKSYEDLLARLQSANIGQAADTQADKVQIRVVDPPVVPTIPEAPNRLLLVSAVLLVGLGLGFSVPVLLSQLDQSFWIVEDLRSLGLPVVGGISLLSVSRRSRPILAAAGFGLATLGLVAVYGGLLVRILHTMAMV